MVLIDSSVWIAQFYESDSLHARARELLMSFQESKIGIHEYVVMEVCTVLQVKAGKTIAQEFIRTIHDNQDISIVFGDQESFQGAIDLFLKQRGSLSLVDLTLAHLSSQHKIVTFDRKLEMFIHTPRR